MYVGWVGFLLALVFTLNTLSVSGMTCRMCKTALHNIMILAVCQHQLIILFVTPISCKCPSSVNYRTTGVTPNTKSIFTRADT